MTKRILIAAVAAAFAASVAADDRNKQAQQQKQGQSQGAAAGASAGKKSFSELDKDNDGTLSQMEAAADANAKSNFEKLDKNNDEKLSREEWQAGQGAGAGASGQQAKRGGDAQQGGAAIVLVPFVVAQAPNFGEGCWARLYDGDNFRGNVLTVLGPGDMPNMRTAFGTDWSGSFDSVQVGPKATVTVYDNENYTQKMATYKPNQRIANLDETRGFFEDIRSLRIACAGGASTAQKSGGSQAAAGGTKQPQSRQKQQK